MFSYAKSLANQCSYLLNNTMFKLTIGAGWLLAQADAYCFSLQGQGEDEIYGYTTARAGLSHRSISSELEKNCSTFSGAYSWYCFLPDNGGYFTQAFEYGKGFFSGTSCTLHVAQKYNLDSCVDRVLKEQCVDGFGTTKDILSTIGICLGGVVVICGMAVAANKLKSKRSIPATAEPSGSEDMTAYIAIKDAAQLGFPSTQGFFKWRGNNPTAVSINSSHTTVIKPG